MAITGVVTSFAEAKIATEVADYDAVATAVVSEAVADYIADEFLLSSGFRSFITFTSKYGAGNHAPRAVLRGLVPTVFGDVRIWAFQQLCQPDQSNNGKEIADNIGNGLQELLVFHAPGGGTGPSLGHRNLDRLSVGYGVKSILSVGAKIADSVITPGTDDVGAISNADPVNDVLGNVSSLDAITMAAPKRGSPSLSIIESTEDGCKPSGRRNAHKSGTIRVSNSVDLQVSNTWCQRVWNGGLPVLPKTGDTDNGALIPGTASSGNFFGGSNREVGAFAGAINVDAGSDELVLSVSDLSATFGCFLSTHSWQR